MKGRGAAVIVLPGLTPYTQALALQRDTVSQVQKRTGPDTVFVLSHPPVITLGRNGHETNIVASKEQLERLGIEVHRVERGGEATYHGPGQLVAYPILHLTERGLGVANYVRLLENVMLRTCDRLGIEAGLREGVTGVFVGQAKIGAIGVRISSGVSFHGLALNIEPNLAHYSLIVPCGMADTPVTSAAQVLGASPGIEIARRALIESLSEVLGLGFAGE